MPWYLYLAFKQLFPSGRRVSLLSLISIVGVTLGVMVLVVVQSVMNGLGSELRHKIVETYGDVRLFTGQIMYDYEGTMEAVLKHPEVVAVDPYAQGMTMVQHGNHPAFPAVIGVQPWLENPVMPVARYVTGGDFEDLDDETVILSSGLARTLGASVGSRIEVYSPLMLERMKADEVMLPRELTVVGELKTGYNQVDNNTMIVSLRSMQELYGLGRGVHGLTLKIKDVDKAGQVAYELREQLGPQWYTLTWMQANEGFLFLLSFEKTMIFFLNLFIVLVAAFSICSTLLVTALRKTREIGLLGAMGARSHKIASIFCLQGLLVGVVGCTLGTLLALLVLHYRDGITDTFMSLSGSHNAFREFYPLMRFPVHYALRDFVVVYVFTLCFSTLAGLIPAWIAARLKPSEAMRNE